MGACAMLPRIIGQGRASELLYTGRSMSAEEGLAWGFFNRVADPCCRRRWSRSQRPRRGPTVAHAMTKKMLHQEWNVSVDQAIDMEAQAQASSCRPGTSTAPTRRSRRSASPCSRATDGPVCAITTGRSSRRGTASSRAKWSSGQAKSRARAWRGRRRHLPAPGAGSGLRRLSPPLRRRASPTCARSRSLREVFAYHAGLADFAFVMQGLGSGPIALAGSERR